jgi:putative transcriptional regulator
MDKDIFAGIMKGAKEAAEIASGKRKPARVHHVRVPKTINVKAIRSKLGMTQHQFAATFGFAERTLKSWEAGEREPESAARVLLKVIEMNPTAVLEATAR